MKSLLSLFLSIVLTSANSFACIHNFDPADPATNVYMTVRSGKKMRTLMSLTGKALKTKNTDAAPVKLVFVKEDSTVTARDLTRMEVNYMNEIIKNVQDHMKRATVMPRGTLRGGVSKNISVIKSVTTNSGTVVEIEEFIKKKNKSYSKVFTKLMADYHFDSTHEDDMNAKIEVALNNGYKLVVAKALIPAGTDNVNIGLEITTPLSEETVTAYIDAVTAQKVMNLWITRESSGGVITYVSDAAFDKANSVMEASKVLFYSASNFKNQFAYEEIGKLISTDYIQEVDGSNKVEFSSLKVRDFKSFEEVYAEGDESALKDYSKTGGTILYAE